MSMVNFETICIYVIDHYVNTTEILYCWQDSCDTYLRLVYLNILFFLREIPFTS